VLLAPPPPPPPAGAWTFALTVYAEGALPGPTMISRVTSSGDVVVMTDTPPSLQIGKASPDDVAHLGALVNAPELWTLQAKGGGEGIYRTYALQRDEATRWFQLYESEPPPAKAVDDAIVAIDKQAPTAKPYDGAFTVTLTSQMEGAALGPLVTMTLDDTGAFTVKSGGDAPKHARASVTDMAVVRMTLAAPDLASVASTQLRGEGNIYTIKIQRGTEVIDRRFGYELPLPMKPIGWRLEGLPRLAK
jgi:hypothetical protein